MYVVISDQKIKKSEVKNSPSQEIPDENESRSAFDVNLASLARYVNNDDILKYLPGTVKRGAENKEVGINCKTDSLHKWTSVRTPF